MALRSGHIQLWELDHKEGRAPKNWYLWTVVLEKTPESFLDSKEIKPVNPKGNQPWILIGRTNAKAEAPVFWLPDVNRWLTGKVPDAGKDWRHKEKMVSEEEMAGWHRQCNEHELGQTLGDDEGQGDLECCSPQSHKESDMTGWSKNNINSWARLGHRWAEQIKRVRVCWGRLLCMIVITKATKCKSKKQFPTWSQNWLLCNSHTVHHREQPLFS